MDAALVDEDTTKVYDEQRFLAIGPIGNSLYVYIYAWNEAESQENAISLRLAEPKERRYYVKNI